MKELPFPSKPQVKATAIQEYIMVPSVVQYLTRHQFLRSFSQDLHVTDRSNCPIEAPMVQNPIRYSCLNPPKSFKFGLLEQPAFWKEDDGRDCELTVQSG